ncbi:MBL fold metallo-hydrolase [Euzebya tangerina]|uniref:MBL fold metallo-hydrolase n=1 Tax=Euzebya tangerina TaxID=591198 RepID=UPI000E323681|nr:MBL fold metallo-hydrolase [Euzebya tangerina]
MSTDASYPERGHVETGGPAAVRQVGDGQGGHVEIRKLSVGPMDNNCYVLVSGGEALLIDAANDAERILEAVEDLDVVTIMTTHGHQDHWQALAAVAEATGAEVVYHPADDDMIPVEADRHVDHGVELSFGSAGVRLIHNPGHTPGSTSVLLGESHVFTGDTLFPGGIGRTHSREEFDVAYEHVVEHLFSLPDDTWVYPGHGDDTTIGDERPSLEEWRERGW